LQIPRFFLVVSLSVIRVNCCCSTLFVVRILRFSYNLCDLRVRVKYTLLRPQQNNLLGLVSRNVNDDSSGRYVDGVTVF
jgi:hypothetical protein